jgi:hypothetical protein
MADSALKPESGSDATVNNDILNPDSSTGPKHAAADADVATAVVDAGADTTDVAGQSGVDTLAQKGVRKKRMGVDPSLIISDGRSKRRRTPTPEPAPAAATAAVKSEAEKDPKDKARATSLGREVYKKVLASVDNG